MAQPLELDSLILLSAHRVQAYALNILREYINHRQQNNMSLKDVNHLEQFYPRLMLLFPSLTLADGNTLRELVGGILRAYGYEIDAQFLDDEDRQMYSLSHLKTAVEKMEATIARTATHYIWSFQMIRLTGDFRTLLNFIEQLRLSYAAAIDMRLDFFSDRFEEMLKRTGTVAAWWKMQLEQVTIDGTWDESLGGDKITQQLDELKARISKLEESDCWKTERIAKLEREKVDWSAFRPQYPQQQQQPLPQPQPHHILETQHHPPAQQQHPPAQQQHPPVQQQHPPAPQQNPQQQQQHPQQQHPPAQQHHPQQQHPPAQHQLPH